MPDFRQRRVSSCPNRDWAISGETSSTTVAAATKVLLGGFSPTAGIDLTVLRTVGLNYVSTDNPGASELQMGAWGIMLVNDLAFAAGAASIPGPFTDGGDDGWLAHQQFAQQWNFADATGEGQAGLGYVFDSKAKRVWPTGMIAAVMVENAHTGHGFSIISMTRMLTQIRGTR